MQQTRLSLPNGGGVAGTPAMASQPHLIFQGGPGLGGSREESDLPDWMKVVTGENTLIRIWGR